MFQQIKTLFTSQHLRLSFLVQAWSECIKAALLVLATTVVMLLIGRQTLGEAVIGFIYLVPIGWATTRWGQGAGICAAVTAALTFDFFFIPPFFTFTVGSLEGWLVLIIFLLVAIVIVGRIQHGLAQAKAHERDAIFMYELSATLAGVRTEEAVARILATHLQQIFQAMLVQVTVYHDPPLVSSMPEGQTPSGKPQRSLPLLGTHHLAGEINLWQGMIPLPALENRLLQTFATQGALALERTRLVQAETQLKNGQRKSQIGDTISSA